MCKVELAFPYVAQGATKSMPWDQDVAAGTSCIRQQCFVWWTYRRDGSQTKHGNKEAERIIIRGNRHRGSSISNVTWTEQIMNAVEVKTCLYDSHHMATNLSIVEGMRLCVDSDWGVASLMFASVNERDSDRYWNRRAQASYDLIVVFFSGKAVLDIQPDCLSWSD